MLLSASPNIEHSTAAGTPGELIANGNFSHGHTGGLPDGWSVVAKNPVLRPHYELVENGSSRLAFAAKGNGRRECFGWAEHRVELKANQTYRLRVRFRIDGFKDVNRHLLHSVHSVQATNTPDFNDGIFDYHRDGDMIVGENRFKGPTVDGPAAVRLYFRYSAHGKVLWDRVSLTECDSIAPRLVKLAVTRGRHGMEHWQSVLETAGSHKCDLILLPEFFDRTYDPVNAQAIDGPAMQFLSQQALRQQMYVCATLYLRHGDLFQNSAPLFDRHGKLLGIYSKNNLIDSEVDLGATSGSEVPVFETDFGKIGIMICADSFYPGVAQLLGLKGAEVILFPSAGYGYELMPSRSADNGVAIAASCLGEDCGVWDAGGNRAGEEKPDPSRFSPCSIQSFERIDDLQMMIVTVDLAQKPSMHYWGGPMASAPGGRRARTTRIDYIEDELSKEIRRW